MSTTAHAATGMDSAAIDFEVPAPGSTGYEEWRKTGKLPEAGESAPAEEVEKIEPKEPGTEAEAAAAGEHVETEAESAPVTTQGKKKDAASRLKEVLAERKKDRELIEQLTRKLAGQPSEEPKPRTAAEPEVKPKVEAKAKPKRPKLADLDDKGKPVFKTYGEFETAVEKYEDDLDQWNRDELLRVVDDRQTKAQKTYQEQEVERVIGQGFQKRVADARSKHADFDAVCFPKDPVTGVDLIDFPKGSIGDQFILESPHGTEVLYYIGSHLDECSKIWERTPDGKQFKMNPFQQARELLKIEHIVSGESRSAAASSKIPAKPVTQAPRVPHQVSGKGPTGDPVAKAVEDGDQEAYTRAENEKALAKWKSRRRG